MMHMGISTKLNTDFDKYFLNEPDDFITINSKNKLIADVDIQKQLQIIISLTFLVSNVDSPS